MPPLRDLHKRQAPIALPPERSLATFLRLNFNSSSNLGCHDPRHCNTGEITFYRISLSHLQTEVNWNILSFSWSCQMIAFILFGERERTLAIVVNVMYHSTDSSEGMSLRLSFLNRPCRLTTCKAVFCRLCNSGISVDSLRMNARKQRDKIFIQDASLCCRGEASFLSQFRQNAWRRN